MHGRWNTDLLAAERDPSLGGLPCAGVLKLKNKANIADFRPLDPDCSCSTCQRYTRAYLHNLVTRNIPSAAILVTYHNIAYTQVRRKEGSSGASGVERKRQRVITLCCACTAP